MSTSPIGSDAAAAVNLTRAAILFDGLANGLIDQVRRAMSVPGGAAHDIERELLRLRARLDGLYPEYQQLFGGLLLEHIGREHVPSVLAALQAEPVQAYFRAAPRMNAELQALLIELARRMSRAARKYLSSTSSSHPKLAPGLARGPGK